MSSATPCSGFSELNLPSSLCDALAELGYETPTPIQAEAITPLLAGRDLQGHAPTGTGKTAAFALPLLARLDVKQRAVQVMVLTPTRELAIQVAEAFKGYASQMRGVNVLPIYGGQPYREQLRQLERGVHVVVGTPGRVMDHMRRGTLKLNSLKSLVLDEGDEMLRMGFVDEVEWILEQTPDNHQIALFSATMPREIERIARRHLNDPFQISVSGKKATAPTIRQRYWPVAGLGKQEALARILEVEATDATLIFVRTRTATTELADQLKARGLAAAAMNGDMAQRDREQMIAGLKNGQLNVLVATDVAARGLDVDRISHVINYDIPFDTEAYIHRIGRTGRAGRAGDAIVFVTSRERRMLSAIERATGQKIEQLEIPSVETINEKRVAAFKQRITEARAAPEIEFMQEIVTQYQAEHDVPVEEIAAALAQLATADRQLLLKKEKPIRSQEDRKPSGKRAARNSKQRVGGQDIERFRIEVGSEHGLEPGNVVGAIANEAGLDAEYIGRIEIDATHSFVELPAGMPTEIFKSLKRVWVCSRQLNITRLSDGPARDADASRTPSHKRTDGAAVADGPPRKPRHKRPKANQDAGARRNSPGAKKAPGEKRAPGDEKARTHRKPGSAAPSNHQPARAAQQG